MKDGITRGKWQASYVGPVGTHVDVPVEDLTFSPSPGRPAPTNHMVDVAREAMRGQTRGRAATVAGPPSRTTQGVRSAAPPSPVLGSSRPASIVGTDDLAPQRSPTGGDGLNPAFSNSSSLANLVSGMGYGQGRGVPTVQTAAAAPAPAPAPFASTSGGARQTDVSPGKVPQHPSRDGGTGVAAAEAPEGRRSQRSSGRGSGRGRGRGRSDPAPRARSPPRPASPPRSPAPARPGSSHVAISTFASRSRSQKKRTSKKDAAPADVVHGQYGTLVRAERAGSVSPGRRQQHRDSPNFPKHAHTGRPSHEAVASQNSPRQTTHGRLMGVVVYPDAGTILGRIRAPPHDLEPRVSSTPTLSPRFSIRKETDSNGGLSPNTSPRRHEVMTPPPQEIDYRPADVELPVFTKGSIGWVLSRINGMRKRPWSNTFLAQAILQLETEDGILSSADLRALGDADWASLSVKPVIRRALREYVETLHRNRGASPTRSQMAANDVSVAASAGPSISILMQPAPSPLDAFPLLSAEDAELEAELTRSLHEPEPREDAHARAERELRIIEEARRTVERERHERSLAAGLPRSTAEPEPVSVVRQMSTASARAALIGRSALDDLPPPGPAQRASEQDGAAPLEEPAGAAGASEAAAKPAKASASASENGAASSKKKKGGTSKRSGGPKRKDEGRTRDRRQAYSYYSYSGASREGGRSGRRNGRRGSYSYSGDGRGPARKANGQRSYYSGYSRSRSRSRSLSRTRSRTRSGSRSRSRTPPGNSAAQKASAKKGERDQKANRGRRARGRSGSASYSPAASLRGSKTRPAKESRDREREQERGRPEEPARSAQRGSGRRR